jgi:hypothetical protein
MLPVVGFAATFARPNVELVICGGILRLTGSENAMGFKVVELQPTPNPNAVKFILDREVVAQPTSFFNAEQATDHPLAKKLFAIPGVGSLLFLGDFVTVNKRPDVPWKDITKAVESVLETA